MRTRLPFTSISATVFLAMIDSLHKRTRERKWVMLKVVEIKSRNWKSYLIDSAVFNSASASSIWVRSCFWLLAAAWARTPCRMV